MLGLTRPTPGSATTGSIFRQAGQWGKMFSHPQRAPMAIPQLTRFFVNADDGMMLAFDTVDSF